MLQKERDYGLRPDPEAEAERAERLRQAQKAQAAKEAGLFFQLVTKSQGAANSVNNTASYPDQNPFEISVPDGEWRRPDPERPERETRLPAWQGGYGNL